MYKQAFFLFILIGFNGIAQQKITMLRHNQLLVIERLEVLNSEYRETNLSITPDGKILYFMSLRGGNPWSVADYAIYKGVSAYDGDIWYSNNISGQWTVPKSLPNTINTSVAEDEPNVSPGGNYVMYQSWKEGWEMAGGPYYISELIGEVWARPQGLMGGINQYFKHQFRKYEGYATDGATLSPDGKLFIVALAPDYDDTMDIYQSVKNKENIWTYLKNTNLSTPGDERSLFIAADNRTIYFASNGYGGYGGLDIFKARRNEDGLFVDIVNIGEPFNSSDDDYSFIITATGEEAYFVRDGDIYYCNLLNANPSIRPLASIQLKGKTTDIYGRPLQSDIEVRKREENLLKAEATTNIYGEYSLSFLKERGDYIQTIRSKGYQNEELTFKLDSTHITKELIHNIDLTPENLILINFDFNEYELSDSDKSELDSITDELYRNKSLRLIIGGHTDEKGTEMYNLDLSKDRVESVSDYLLSKGIPKKIMRLDYFGESFPKVGKEVPNFDKINRRVEIKVVEIKKNRK